MIFVTVNDDGTQTEIVGNVLKVISNKRVTTVSGQREFIDEITLYIRATTEV